jgi:hypothetical protein
MTTTKIRVIEIITALLIFSTATTLTGLPGVTSAHATPTALGTEQVSNNTADTTTTTITPPITTGQEQQGQQPVHITKDSTTSYIISGGSSSIGSFDTTYRIAGENSAVRASEGLIISTITSDYSSSPTIGYVMVGNDTTTTTTPSAGTADGGAATTLPNPFATAEQINEKITSELRRVIGEAEGNNTDNSMTTLQEGGQQQQQPMMEIKCVFGMELDYMRCDNYIPSAEAIGEAADLIPSGPLENDEFETDDNIS